MFSLVKANYKYTFQNKFYFSMLIFMFLCILVVTGIDSFQYGNAIDLNNFQRPITIFLFVSTYLLVGVPLITPKTSGNSNYSMFMLSFPVNRRDFVTSHYLTLLIYMTLTIIAVFTVSIVTMLIGKLPIQFSFFLLQFFIILYSIGIMGSLYILIYFSTKLYKPIMFLLYFVGFFSSTSFLNFNSLFYSDYFNILLYIGMLFIPVSYIVSLITAIRKEF